MRGKVRTRTVNPLSTKDDRAQFLENTRRQSLALGQDAEAFKRSAEMFDALNAYDYSYLWTWMGAPIIQMPADIMATQEVIWATKPDIVIETGVARGGSVLFMASILELMGRGQVIGVDIDIRAHNRDTIENHPMSKRVTLIEGGSVDETTLAAVRSHPGRMQGLWPNGLAGLLSRCSRHDCRAFV